MSHCKKCAFKNPVATVTGVILRNNSLLLVKRATEPFKGFYDLPGGFMQEKETPHEAISREITEELGVLEAELHLMRSFWGYAEWEDKSFPIISHFFLIVSDSQKITLNEENTEYKWVPLKELNPDEIAFDSNQAFCRWLKEKFTWDLDKIKELISQLDPEAIFEEQKLYKALLNGFVSAVKDENGELIGMGWIFTRDSLLRRQGVIEDMIVDEKHRGKGIGRKILRELIDWAKTNALETIELTTNPKREAANALYKSEGFTLHNTNHYLKRLTQ